jgi:TDG/mug DNA glycosylase family protein
MNVGLARVPTLRDEDRGAQTMARDLDRFRNATVEDLVDDRVRLLFVGINPSLWTAAVQAHFARPGNRFYPALQAGGIIDRTIDASSGYTATDREYLLSRGLGITNLAPRATARADELSTDDLRAGGARLVTLVAQRQPAVVAVLGITAYRLAFARPRAVLGPQEERLGGVALWVLPNPSGLNAHASLASLAIDYAQAAVAAGIELLPSLPEWGRG